VQAVELVTDIAAGAHGATCAPVAAAAHAIAAPAAMGEQRGRRKAAAQHGPAMATSSGWAVPATPAAAQVDGDAGGGGLEIGDGPGAGAAGKKKDTWYKRHPAVHHRLSAFTMGVQDAAGGRINLSAMWEQVLADPTLSGLVANVNLKKVQAGMVNRTCHLWAANDAARYSNMGH
jgi:hypothetical protein